MAKKYNVRTVNKLDASTDEELRELLNREASLGWELDSIVPQNNAKGETDYNIVVLVKNIK